jgi:transcriptional regulator with XRE-family HTH domain
VRCGAKWKPVAGHGFLAALKTAIRDELEASGCSQKDLAGHLGMSEKHVSQVLTGKVAGTFETVEKMASAVGLVLGFRRGDAR